jgi:hypothetical protein
VIVALGLLVACNGREEPAAGSDTAGVPGNAEESFVDSSIAPAVAGADGWNYVERAAADVLGDSAVEQIVLMARVELYRGRPAWDDGQPWQVYVETASGARHYLYAQRLQLGTLSMRVAHADSGQRATLLLLEHLPHSLRVLEAVGSDSTIQLRLRFERTLDAFGQQASPRFP